MARWENGEVRSPSVVHDSPDNTFPDGVPHRTSIQATRINTTRAMLRVREGGEEGECGMSQLERKALLRLQEDASIVAAGDL